MIGSTLTRPSPRPRTVKIGSMRHGNRNSDWQRPDLPDPAYGYLVFQYKDLNTPITLMDVRDAVQCCSGILNEQSKRQCYLQFSVDGEMAEKYFTKIESMERLYRSQSCPPLPPPPKPTKRDRRRFPGKWFPFGNKE